MTSAAPISTLSYRSRPEIVEVTPRVAERWLSRNTHNRNLRPRLVERHARDMREGRWVFNAASIVFSREGQVLDGQHRLHGVVMSGATIQAVVVRDLDPKAQESIDNNAVRTAADSLHLRGHANYTAKAATARRVLQWKASGPSWHHLAAYKPTNAEILELIESDELVVRAAEVAGSARGSVAAATSVLGLAYWLFASLDTPAAGTFFERLITGAGLEVGNPILTFSKRLGDLRQPGYRLDEERQLALIIRAWNAGRKGRSITKLATHTTAAGDSFPRPR